MKTIKDVDIANKRVIIRLDLNVPIKDNVILDDTRIVKSLKTLEYVLDRASKVIILSHLGRIKTAIDKEKNSLKIVCDYLSKLIKEDIAFCDYNDLSIIENNKIIMMENTRYFDLDNNKESNCDEELSKYFASFGDIFINDAFGVSHRSNASNVGICKYIESCNGFLMEEEVNNLNKLLISPERPYVVIMGGKKVSDKIKVIDNLIKKVDKLLIGGALAYTFLKAKGINVGSSFIEEEYISYAKELLDKYPGKIVLPVDNFIRNNSLKDINNMDLNDIGFDIGKKTVYNYKEELKSSKTIFFNGPVGAFEDGYSYGTKELCEYLNSLKSYVVIGGGDTLNAVNSYAPNNNFVISTGGGASLEYLEGKKLPGIVEE